MNEEGEHEEKKGGNTREMMALGRSHESEGVITMFMV